ncbi:ArnT family glycosyltransferase [Arenimonas sp.]|uniref:ArnT family glycosyltransferase n=1 Tax=Arenimonas sp. TaxID=1872635 RepID=UPI0039E4AEC2
MKRDYLRVNFLVLWASLSILKLVLAWRLPLFVDEAFYAWESRHPAWAYSDLPGMTAWLIRIGTTLGGQTELAVRLPFLIMGAALPWLVVRQAARWFGEEQGWRAGLLALLMPLSGLLGLLALPDVPMTFAALLSLEGIARCRERVSWSSCLVLLGGLVLGALSHYRFALVVMAGLAGLLCDLRGRQLLRESRLWGVALLGACAWLPLLTWNLQHGGAGLRFQLIERNPWSFHADSWQWLPIQAILLTPPLFVLLLAAWRRAHRPKADGSAPGRLVHGVACVSVAGYFLLGFFADRERVSFHWPLAGWLALLVVAPPVLVEWKRWARASVYAGAATGLALALAWLSFGGSAALRSEWLTAKAYPDGFAGWREVADAVRRESPSSETRIVADNFALAAQLVFALDRDDIQVLDHARNRKHGRAEQLHSWNALFDPRDRSSGDMLLVVEDSAVPLKQRLAIYHARCALFGAMPMVRALNIEHGRKRFLFYRFDAANRTGSCAMPALAWIDAPAHGAQVQAAFEIHGWAFKDGAGLRGVDVLLDGKPIGSVQYGIAMPHVAEYWRISSDTAQPKVGFRARVDASDLPPGRHRLGLRLHGRDGSVEDWPEQRITIAAPR